MADFSKTRDFGNSQGKLTIREERQFTNPHIRFVRIRGRIVPILNKKRIGQTVSKTGNALITAGAVLATLGGGASFLHKRKEKKISKFMANPRTAKIFNAAKASASMHKNVRSTGLSLSKFGKRSIIAGLALGIAGIATKFKGASIQADSPFGADL